ncbi:MAG: fimbria/pilus outer membrane usher protein [Polaromonas sp.]
MTYTKLVSAVLCCLSAAPVASWAAETASGVVNIAQAETMVLRVMLNTEDKGDIFVGRTPDLDFLVKVEDLKAMGIKEPAGTVVLRDGEPHMFLKSMRGVSFSFEEKALALNITAEPQLLPSHALQLRAEQRIRGVVPRGNSAFFNYALNSSGGDSVSGSRAGFAGELGLRFGDYLFLSDGSTTQAGQAANGQRKFVRLMSSVTHDDRDNLRRTVIGDFFTPSRDFSNGVNLGGISISKLYGLNPYLIQFPTQSVSGNVALPSDLEVYLDGQRIRSEKLKPGEFELRDLLAYGGARNVQLVLRDAFGRVQQFSYSFYFSDQPLRQGLHEYSYNLGALRRDYGTESNHYGPVAFTLFHRYGMSDALTLGLRAEGKRNFSNAGPLATVVLGSAGVVNLALAGSSVDSHRGAAGSMVYNYQAKSWSLGFSLRRDWGEYATLGDPPTITNRKHESSVVTSYYLPGRGTVSLSHSALSTRDAMAAFSATPIQPFNVSPLENRRVTALSYSVPLVSGRVSLTASLSHIKDKESRNEAFVGLIFFLDKDYSAAANYRGNKDNHTESLQLTKNQPIGEGLGYVLSADRATSPTAESLQFKSNIQYNAPAAILRAEYGRRHDGGQTANDYRVSVAGGLAYVDGEVALGRPVTESFGIVKVGELPGVAIAVNGQPIGKTNAQGKVFVPTLTPYFDNDVSISPESVPIEYSIPSTVQRVSPSLRSGAVIDFGVTKIQAFSGKLKSQQAGAMKPVEFQEISFSADGKMQRMQTGRGGEFYIENRKPGTYTATVPLEGKPCQFDLTIPRSDETFVELGELVCRKR